MILAAACYALGEHTDLLPACGEDGAEPPPELLLGLQIRAFPGSMPEAGGLRDQRAGEMERVILALNIHNAWDAYRHQMREPGGNVTLWAQANPEQWRIVSEMIRAYGE